MLLLNIGEERAILHRMAGKVVELRPELWVWNPNIARRCETVRKRRCDHRKVDMFVVTPLFLDGFDMVYDGLLGESTFRSFPVRFPG